MSLRRFYKKITPGFEVIDTKEWLQKNLIEIYLKIEDSTPRICSKCHHELDSAKVGEHSVRVRSMDIHGFKTYFCFKKPKHHCSNCHKVRSINIDWISPETPHVTEEYAWWLARLCEITPITNAAEFTGNSAMSLWRFDFNRMKRMLQRYKIPKVRKISVDEVYARKRKYGAKESRDKRFFTIICDLETKRVIWVSESREKAALDEFFRIIGPDRCKDIEVVAMDQHDSYKLSVQENCPMATVVWDRFHIMQNFNMAIDEDRKWLHRYIAKDELKRLTRGKFKRLFVKKAGNRTPVENRHINDVLKENEEFAYLELIKEGMYQLYDSQTELEAKDKFKQLGEWIEQCDNFYSLKRWWKNFNDGWDTFKNYFRYPVTTALSEGMNNVIKTLKKRAYGYRNMAYFKLKIMQVCGYLNSKWVSMNFQ